MVADAMTLPAGSGLVGQPLTLLSVLASTPDRRQQLETVRAYWQLLQAVAEYHFCLDHAQRLDRIKPVDGESPWLRLAKASAAAMRCWPWASVSRRDRLRGRTGRTAFAAVAGAGRRPSTDYGAPRPSSSR